LQASQVGLFGQGTDMVSWQAFLVAALPARAGIDGV